MTLPPFAYYGGKTRSATKIVSVMPPHGHYVEPFAGSLAVLLAKPRSTMETVNDLDHALMTFWRVLRDHPDELRHRCELSPHGRAEHAAAYDLDHPDDIEVARRVWVLLAQGRGGRRTTSGWRFHLQAANTSMPDVLKAYRSRMPAIATRLAGVSLECRPALEIISEYGQFSDTLLYLDPPYVRDARNSVGYMFEMGDHQAHRELATALHLVKAIVMLSGYDSPLYDELYDGWHRIEMKAHTSQGMRAMDAGQDTDRTEVLWSNRPLHAQGLFDFDDAEVTG